MLGVSHVVTTSVGMCDIDIRPVTVFIFYVFFRGMLSDGFKISQIYWP